MNTDERVDRVETRLTAIDGRLDGLETKFDHLAAKVDRLAVRVDEGFAKVEERFAKADERFAMLYDVVKAQAEKTDRRFEELTALIQTGNTDLRASIRLSYGSLERRMTALEHRAQSTKPRQ